MDNEKGDYVGKICCGFGHRRITDRELADKLYETICALIKYEGVCEFIAGGMGDFDTYYCEAVRKVKREYRNINLTLVEPYFSNKLNRDKAYYELYYDGIIIPEEILGCYPKAAIKKRNLWMIDRSDFVISYVRNDKGGAYTAQKYAKMKNKTIIFL